MILYPSPAIYEIKGCQLLITVSFHGRAGQGVETAINVFSKAAILSGFRVQSLFFPGAHVWGFVKIDKNAIVSKQVEPADMALVFDASVDIRNLALKESASVIMNTAHKPNTALFKKRRLKAYAIDGVGASIAGNALDAVMLGALSKNLQKVSMKSIRAVDPHAGAGLDEGYKNLKMVK